MMPASADQWLANVPRETLERLHAYVALLREANQTQNLVAKSTLEDVWSRHIVDCAQLTTLVPPQAGSWLDIGSGAGLPGIVLALLGAAPMTLVEPRRLRAQFLEHALGELGLLDQVSVVAAKVEQLRVEPVAVITARAVAKLDMLFRAATHVATEATTWVLLKGRSAAEELDEARRSWHGDFTLHPSITDPAASIVIARGVRPRKGRP